MHDEIARRHLVGQPEARHRPSICRTTRIDKPGSHRKRVQDRLAHIRYGPAMTSKSKWRVLGCKGCGSTIVEAALITAEIPYDREELDYSTPEGHKKLVAVNPLAQVPTLVMPDGSIMTESAAIVLHLDELVPKAGLLAPPGDPLRRDALRWLVFLVAAVYPTWTYGDDVAKWGCGQELRDSTEAHRKKLWKQIEGEAKGPWFLGARFSALDLYIATMTRWRPGRAWFEDGCPKLTAIGRALDKDPRFTALWAANFD
jgi:GST-like protein